ncbi:hydrophobe/amphiphile efflux-1 (HAE1) family transporter [Caulobacter sp. AP07]|uniref:multidrug efflux RND transporter permease subunit n=1 Tax=Caulobacter sp. AP07 TaxID=1144304 RepID=UPI000271F2AC|nr:multidrug efflux RND transporter permease subunit [Caulobacter sp. AP07]EJL30831.1 hydrophobe/amphiphile efflux-1 (HAE1) family transporter [Caulobacter sp. AP07]
MPLFFIQRPVFAWVLAIFIILAGLLAIPRLPIARFPSVAPPSVSISASYPGATTQTLTDSVIAPIERELASVKNLLYFESSADTSGSASITATFRPGTNPDMAQVDVQNRLKTVEARLPQTVRQNGVDVQAAASSFLMMVSVTSDDGAFDRQELGDYVVRNLVSEIQRVPGVGKVQSFASERAMRVWIDPKKLAAADIAFSEVTAAIAAQNLQIAPGRLGDMPAPAGQAVSVPLTASGQLQTVEQFKAITLRAKADGSRLTLEDVARVELGSQSYAFETTDNGKVSAVAAIQMAPGANAVATAQGVRDRMASLGKSMPAGMRYAISYDTAPFVKISIEKVVHTLIEAMVLVFLVMFVFLQNVRYTLIPTIVAPIALLGTLAVMLLAGFSINVLTMFGMVLAIGIIVDDAIVVVENVERIMAREGLSPREATQKAMKEITGAVIGITLVLSAVFIPMAFASGSVGAIYRQFSLAMAVSILFSALLALSLTPALCATLLKPVDPHHHQKKGFFGWFNRRFDRLTEGYAGWIASLVKRTGRAMIVFVALVALLAVAFARLPGAFLPDEDQGSFLTMITLPADATAERTRAVIKQYEQHLGTRKAIASNTSIVGFGFSGSGQNAAMAFTNLVDWDQRHGATAQAEVAAAQQAMSAVRDGTVTAVNPPAIDELGTSSAFALRLQDLRNQGPAAMAAAQAQLLRLAAGSRKLASVYPDGLPDGSSLRLDIDRERAEAQGVSFDAINSTLSAAMGSAYVNDFPNQGRLQQVIVQAEPGARMQIDDVLGLYVKNRSGGMTPLSAFVAPHWEDLPLQMVRYNGYPTSRISGNAAPGVASGDAMAEMERLAGQLPAGFSVAWTGQSLQERVSGDEAPMLMALSMLVVFLVLAGLYESWTIPLSVMLVVPLGLIGAVAATMIRGLPNDVFFKVGMITIIGLSAKNAILIVEFAKMLREQGRGLAEATIEAARLRLRPIIMTSLAFTLGVVPLMIAQGASAATQHSIGTGVFGGMLTATFLAIFFVPVFFVFVLTFAESIAARLKGPRSAREPRQTRAGA